MKKFKSHNHLLVTLSTFLCGSILTFASTIPVHISGEPLAPTTDASTYISANNRVMLPFRQVSESLNIDIHWESPYVIVDGTHAITGKPVHIQLKANDPNLLLNGTSYTSDQSIEIVNGRSYIPIRLFAEVLGYDVEWTNQSVYITLPTKAPEEDAGGSGSSSNNSSDEATDKPSDDSNNNTSDVPSDGDDNSTPDIPSGNNNSTPNTPSGDNNGTPDTPSGDNEGTPDVPSHDDNNSTPDVPSHDDSNSTPDVPSHDDNNSTPDVPSDDDNDTSDKPSDDNNNTPNWPNLPSQPNEPTLPEVPTNPEETPVDTRTQFENEVLTLVNKERQKLGIKPLQMDENVREVAREKSRDMKVNNYFDHNSPTYGSPFDMLKKFNISYSRAAENIAAGYSTPSAVVEGWMNSDGHRRNILDANLTHIGIGYYASGHYWTQIFITPK